VIKKICDGNYVASFIGDTFAHGSPSTSEYDYGLTFHQQFDSDDQARLFMDLISDFVDKAIAKGKNNSVISPTQS
jgi:hypothetical protein